MTSTLKNSATFLLIGAASLCCTAEAQAQSRTNHAPECSAKTLAVEPPAADSTTLRINPIVLAPACVDPDGDKLSLLQVSQPARQAVGPGGRKLDMIEIDLSTLHRGSRVVSFQVVDGKGGVAKATVTLSIKNQ